MAPYLMAPGGWRPQSTKKAREPQHECLMADGLAWVKRLAPPGRRAAMSRQAPLMFRAEQVVARKPCEKGGRCGGDLGSHLSCGVGVGACPLGLTAPGASS